MSDANEAMAARIRRADMMDIGYAYLRHVDAPWLSWPLLTLPVDYPRWLRAIVALVAGTPRCGRTEAEAWRELRRIDNARLRRMLDGMGVAS